MNRRIAIALLLACIVSGTCTWWLGGKIKLAAAAHDQRQLRYLVAARTLEAGEVLHPADLTWTLWPMANPLRGALGATEVALGRVILYPLEAGQPILERDLADPGIGAGLASRIPDGKRALALRSDDVVGVAGFLAPGSRVDVLVTYRMASSAEPWTATVLENAEVLAAGQRTEPDPTGKPASATVLTLLVSPLEAERAVLASTQGTVHFVLRNGLDKAKSDNSPISLAWLAAGTDDGSGPGAAAGQTSFADPSPHLHHAAAIPRWQVETVLGEQSDRHPQDASDTQGANRQP
jgi:pilus assembly protein CpaB